MTKDGLTSMIETQPERQTGTLGEALKNALAQPEPTPEPTRHLTIWPLPNSNRVNFTLRETEDGPVVKRGHFLDSTHAAVVIDRLLEKFPTLTVVTKEATA